MALLSIPTKSSGDQHTATEMNEVVQAIVALQEVPGFGNYDDDASSDLTITSTPSKLTINALGSQTNEAYLPYEIRGVSSLWDSVTNKITPINIGDEYNLRVDFTISAKTGSPSEIDFTVDIGGQSTITIPILKRTIPITKTAPFSFNIGFPIYGLDTFKANGGQLFLNVNSGTVTVTARDIYISRVSNGQR